MAIGSGFRELGRFLDDCERRGGPVERVDVAGVTDTGDGIETTVELTVSLDRTTVEEEALADPRVGPDGTVRFALASTTDLVPVADHAVTVEPTGATIDDEDTVCLRFAATTCEGDAPTSGTADRLDDQSADPDRSASTSDADTLDGHDGVPDTASPGTPATPSPRGLDDSSSGTLDTSGSGSGDRESSAGRDLPPFKDPDRLAEVYESCETFAEMAETLEMDVTAETVRRYMIDFDIHEPDTYQTGGGGAENRVVLSDGIGLPDDVTAEDLVETVERSNTIYEVKQDIDIDRDDALEMLQELNLLDLVVGRLATEGERNITREDIVDRLREASAVQ
jgi:hypothetical protein